MSSQPSTAGLLNLNDRIRLLSTHTAVTCERCRNTFLVLLLEPGANFNDFGLRHCPFCGRITDRRGNDFFTE